MFLTHNIDAVCERVMWHQYMMHVQLMWYRSNFKMLGTYTIRCSFENPNAFIAHFHHVFLTLKIEILNAFISDAQWKWLIYKTELPLLHRFSTCNSFLCYAMHCEALYTKANSLYFIHHTHGPMGHMCMYGSWYSWNRLEIRREKIHWNEVKYFSYVLSNRFLFQVSTRR